MSDRKAVVERDFVYKGFRCVVVFNCLCFRCGYVAVTDDPNVFKTIVRKKEIFDVHGGVTYSDGGENSHHTVDSNSYWLGFDCGHYGDEIDVDQAVEYKLISPEVEPIMRMQEGLFGGHAMTEEEVAQECKKLVDQMKEVGYHG